MKWPDWKSPKSHSRIFAVLTTLLIFSVASHPELRVLVPVLDTLGLEIIVSLLALQALSIFPLWCRPYLLLCAWRVVIWLVAIGRVAMSIPVFQSLSNFLGNMLRTGSGYLGEYMCVQFDSLLGWAQLGPNYSFKATAMGRRDNPAPRAAP